MADVAAGIDSRIPPEAILDPVRDLWPERRPGPRRRDVLWSGCWWTTRDASHDAPRIAPNGVRIRPGGNHLVGGGDVTYAAVRK